MYPPMKFNKFTWNTVQFTISFNPIRGTLKEPVKYKVAIVCHNGTLVNKCKISYKSKKVKDTNANLQFIFKSLKVCDQINFNKALL